MPDLDAHVWQKNVECKDRHSFDAHQYSMAFTAPFSRTQPLKKKSLWSLIYRIYSESDEECKKASMFHPAFFSDFNEVQDYSLTMIC